jgi:preprotein translocase subunit SecF
VLYYPARELPRRREQHEEVVSLVDIIGKRYWFFLISGIIIIPGLISLLLFGLKPSIDFTGGTLWEMSKFEKAVDVAVVRGIFTDNGIGDVALQTSEKGQERGLLVRSKAISPEAKASIDTALRSTVGSYTELRFESVGPTVGQEVTQRAQLAVGLACLGILLYISFAFRKLPNPVRYGVCAITALIHDVLLVVGIFSILGKLFDVEIDALFLTALLTGPIGFSVHDTIVVFDRIRENVAKYPGETFERVVNHSLLQTLDRSINTSLTVIFTLSALFLFGGVTIRMFVLAMLIGIVTGTYSSIFNATPLLVVWENGEIGKYWRKLRGKPA